MFYPRLYTRWLLVGMILTAGLTCNQLRADEPKPARHALLVGVKDYDHDKLRGLKYTENDVSELATLLRDAGYQVVLLTSSTGKMDAEVKPTRANIEKQLKNILSKCKKGDTVVVAFAGHGLQFEKVEDSFFCPEDAIPLADEESRKTLLSLKTVYELLEKSPGAVKLLLVDACRNDPSMGRSVEASGAGRPPAGVAALYSCSAGERAYEHDNYRHGIFFYHVLEGLRGKAKNGDEDVTWDTLQAYVRKKVSADTPKLLDGVQQTPSLNAGELRGEPPVLIGREAKLARRLTLAFDYAALDQESAERLGLPRASQPQVGFIVPGGGGETLGLRHGDVIYRVNGRPVENILQLQAALKELSVGDRVALEINRDKQIITLTGRNETLLTAAEEIRRVRELAIAENALAQNYLGNALFNGEDTAKDEVEAVKWYRKAADQGNPRAQNNLGYTYAHGKGVAKDEAEAVRWFRKAADQDLAAAWNQLGYAYQNGRGVPKDDGEALKCYRKGVEQNDAPSQNNLGFLYHMGRGVTKDETEAVKWYRKAAEQDLPIGRSNLGFMYLTGRGVAKNATEALNWIHKAAEQGDAQGQSLLGDMYFSGQGLAQDDKEAVKWYRKAAEQEGVHSYLGQTNLGAMYQQGRGVAKDEKEAVKWYRKAADNGYAQAQELLGSMYWFGRGVTQDYKEAGLWYRKAADQGYASAYWWIGLQYLQGRGVAQDTTEAIKNFRKAAELGDAFTQNYLGDLYFEGKNVDKDQAEAVKWYRKAADQGNAQGQFNLGWVYEKGQGVAKDEAEGVKWYRKAAAQGNKNALDALKRLNLNP